MNAARKSEPAASSSAHRADFFLPAAFACLQFQLTVNFVALVIAFVAAVTSGETPLNVIQLLWVNLIMDALGALGKVAACSSKEAVLMLSIKWLGCLTTSVTDAMCTFLLLCLAARHAYVFMTAPVPRAAAPAALICLHVQAATCSIDLYSKLLLSG